MKPKPGLQPQSKPLSKPPEGRVLKVKPLLSGLTEVQVDNGIPHTFTLVTRTESAHILLGEDMAAIRAHLHTRQPGHFRRKTVT